MTRSIGRGRQGGRPDGHQESRRPAVGGPCSGRGGGPPGSARPAGFARRASRRGGDNPGTDRSRADRDGAVPGSTASDGTGRQWPRRPPPRLCRPWRQQASNAAAPSPLMAGPAVPVMPGQAAGATRPACPACPAPRQSATCRAWSARQVQRPSQPSPVEAIRGPRGGLAGAGAGLGPGRGCRRQPVGIGDARAEPVAIAPGPNAPASHSGGDPLLGPNPDLMPAMPDAAAGQVCRQTGSAAGRNATAVDSPAAVDDAAAARGASA